MTGVIDLMKGTIKLLAERINLMTGEIKLLTECINLMTSESKLMRTSSKLMASESKLMEVGSKLMATRSKLLRRVIKTERDVINLKDGWINLMTLGTKGSRARVIYRRTSGKPAHFIMN